MKHLYFIRHGESEMNIKHLFSGHLDTPLTETGHAQAKETGQKASRQGLSFDIIVSSPLQRAHHTAKHVASATGYPPEKIESNELFKERYYGKLEGKRSNTPKGVKYYFDESSIDDVEKVETLQEFQARAEKALEYLHSLDHQTVLVVSHGALGRALYRAINDLPIDKRDIRYKNAELVKFI